MNPTEPGEFPGRRGLRLSLSLVDTRETSGFKRDKTSFSWQLEAVVEPLSATLFQCLGGAACRLQRGRRSRLFLGG